MKKVKSTVFYLVIAAFVGSMALPFLWLILSSIKTRKELFTLPVKILPSSIEWRNYTEVFQSQPFAVYIGNSAAASLITTVLVITVACMASYTLARVKIKGKSLFMAAMLSISLLPPVTLLNPIYKLLSTAGLLNTPLGLAIAISAIELPMAVWFLTGYFESIPMELEESGMLDGASFGQIFRRIILPLVSPGVFTISILVFINAWNNYLFALVFNPLPKSRTVTVAITLFQSDYSVPWEVITAAAVMITAPLILVVLILQKRIISGMMEGGVKG